MIKKTAILLLTLLIAAGLGIVLYNFLYNYMMTPKKEGIAHLKPAKLKLYSELTAYASSDATSQNEKPDGLIDLPEEISYPNDNIRFFSLPLGKHTVFVIVQKNSTSQAKVWIDTNLDNCLSDEKAVSGTLKKYTKNRTTPWEYFDFGQIQLKSNDFTSAYIRLTSHKTGRYLMAEPTSYLRGKIKLGNQIYRIAVTDGDFDGNYATPYKPVKRERYWSCDTFLVDHNSNALSTLYDNGKIVPLGKYYKFKANRYVIDMPTDEKKIECYYSINLSEDGKLLKMLPVEPEMGILKIGDNIRLSTHLLSDTATQGIKLRNEIKLPAGKYQMHSGQLEYMQEDETNPKLLVDFYNDIRKGQFTIAAGETVTLNPGPPFTVKSDVSKQSERQLSINAGLIGNEGEEYGLRLIRSGTRPTIKILDENDKVIHTGQMEYG